MLGSNLPSNNRAEGNVDGRFRLSRPRGALPLLGGGFLFPRQGPWVSCSPGRFTASRVCRQTVAPSSNSIDVPSHGLENPGADAVKPFVLDLVISTTPASAASCGRESGRLPRSAAAREPWRVLLLRADC